MSTNDLGTVLITGASGGIGLAMAKRLAPRSTRLILTARSTERLEAAARECRSLGANEVVVLPVDLAATDGPDQLLGEIARRSLTVDVLVNNAGYGLAGEFLALGEAEQLDIVRLNVLAVVALTRRLLPGMVQRRRGIVFNVASTAGFAPGPYMATYYATKAFVIAWSEAIRLELAGSGVRVTTFCPGPTLTGFADRAGAKETALFRRGFVMDVESVADLAVRSLDRGGIVIPGLSNKLLALVIGLSPRSIVLRVAAQLNRSRVAS